MTILVVGATGATGRLLLKNLLDRRMDVRAIVRSPDKLSDEIKLHSNFSMILESISELDVEELAEYVDGCNAVASCLGHNLSFKGIFGHPRRLVTDTTRRLCEAIESNNPETPVKFVLMNTAGNSNLDIPEEPSFAHRMVVGIIRLLIPPQKDNEMAADYLRTEIGQDNQKIQWVVVRPDTLVDQENISPYQLHPSPTRSAIFNAGKTSRINVAEFMASLIADDVLWDKWKGQMPVLYNQEET